MRGIFPAINEPKGRRFQSLLLHQCPVVVILPAKHKLIRRFRKDIDAKALSGYPLLVPSPEHAPGYADRLKNVRAAVPFTPASIQAVDGVRNLLGLVAAGYGVAILPEAAVIPVSNDIRVRPLRAPVPKFELKLLWLRENSSIVLQNFLSVARSWSKRAIA